METIFILLNLAICMFVCFVCLKMYRNFLKKRMYKGDTLGTMKLAIKKCIYNYQI